MPGGQRVDGFDRAEIENSATNAIPRSDRTRIHFKERKNLKVCNTRYSIALNKIQYKDSKFHRNSILVHVHVFVHCCVHDLGYVRVSNVQKRFPYVYFNGKFYDMDMEMDKDMYMVIDILRSIY